jgi:prophage DNA circulation protein
MATEFEEATIARWRVSNVIYKFPVESITDDGGNRIVVRERPYRDGAKLDDTGAKPKSFNVVVRFENTIEEPGLEQQVETPLFPTLMQAMLNSFAEHKTGDLTLPILGAFRCRADSYSRTMSFEQRDCAVVSFRWVEDNEDNVEAQSFAKTSARATSRRIAEETTFDSEGLGSLSDSIADLEDFADDLEGAINAPGEFVEDVRTKSKRVQKAVKSINDTFGVVNQEGRDLLLKPQNSKAARQLSTLADTSARAEEEKTRGRPTRVTTSYPTQRSIFDIAVELDQDVVVLINMNQTRIENLLAIPAGTNVYVLGSR